MGDRITYGQRGQTARCACLVSPSASQTRRSGPGLFDCYLRHRECRADGVDLFYDADVIRSWPHNATVKAGGRVAVSFSEVAERKRLEDELKDKMARLHRHALPDRTGKARPSCA